MIYKASGFPDCADKSYLTVNIKCLCKGFEGLDIAPDLWVQKNEDIEALILGYGENVYLSYFKGDTEETEAFLKTIGFKNIFTNKPFSFINIKSRSSVFKKAARKQPLPLPEIPPLSVLYEKLSFGQGSDIALPEFSNFAPDVSHLLRHKFAFSVCEDYGAALVYTDGCDGILKGISVNDKLRNKGYGSLILTRCLEFCPDRLFAATNTSENFYLKNGFEKEPYTIYCGELK